MSPVDELHGWLAEHWDPELTVREWWAQLARSGWGQPHWPTDWFGRGLGRAEGSAVTRAIREFGAVTAPVGFGTGMAGPTLITHGTDEQKARHLPGMVDGTDAFCQLFSEPNAGSDLAGLQCRAERDGAEWVVNGQKVWTSSGQIANKAMLVARTDVDVPKHAGISYFFIDMTQPGIEMRPLREMTGRSFFNEVFLTGARIPAEDLIGGEGNGWAVANTTLAFERALSGGSGGSANVPDPGPFAGNLDRRVGEFAPRTRDTPAPSDARSPSERLATVAREQGRSADPVVRDLLVRLSMLERVNTLNTERARALQRIGQDLPGLPNLAKMSQNHAIRLAREVTFAVLQASAMLHAYEGDAAPATTAARAAELEAFTGVRGLDSLVETALFASAPPIYGGSDQIQRNIVSERVLGLPREPSADKGIPFRDLPKN